MSAPDPILEAAARAWDRAALDHEWGTCPCALCDRDGAVLAILTAVRPLIEAEVREAVAREIEAVRRPGPCPPEYLAGVAWTLVAAARIARGSDV